MAEKHTTRRIGVLTGTRAEYGLLTSLLAAIRERNDLKLDLVATGMHLLDQTGNTVHQIEQDGWNVAHRIAIYSGRDRRDDLGAALGTLVTDLSAWLVKRRTDFLALLGDRVEVLGGACAALMAGVPIAHLHGGELAPGELDDRIRFAVSGMANLHFVSTHDARRRLIRTGQRPETIHVVGAIALDALVALRRRLARTNRRSVRADLGLHRDRATLTVVYHPCGFGARGEYERMTTILAAVRPYQGIIIGPNTDPGYAGVVRAIRPFLRANRPRWKFFVSLERSEYLRAIWASDVLVGNSSSGIIEANVLGTAAVNIGPRQLGRQRNGNAVIDSTYNTKAIRRAVRAALARSRARQVRPSRAFGAGDAGRQIAEALATVRVNRELAVKTYCHCK